MESERFFFCGSVALQVLSYIFQASTCRKWIILLKIARDLTRPGPPKGSCLEGNGTPFREI